MAQMYVKSQNKNSKSEAYNTPRLRELPAPFFLPHAPCSLPLLFFFKVLCFQKFFVPLTPQL